MRRLKLKVCGMQDPHNIRAIGALLPDFMGFIFAPSSPRCVTTQLDLSHLPASICTVGVFRDQSIEFIKERVQSFGLKAVQLHGVEDLRYMELLRAELPDILIIKAVQVTGIRDLAELKALQGTPNVYLFDSASAGSGQSFEWSWLSSYRAGVPFMLAGGVGAHNIDKALSLAQELPDFFAIDVNSKVESEIGVKDAAKINELLERIAV
ncbi:MAG: phosphoribosylanthranilate isomerase [Proteobacteria bacterium]|nr:phosphoribosylanthranilate isomerase [Pseudomonadota bacterium]